MKPLAVSLVVLLLAPAAWARSYTTSFPRTENPISESGNWINGGTTGIDWTNVQTTPGLAFGTMVGTDPSPRAYADTTAILSGLWGPNQTVRAIVDAPRPSNLPLVYEEVELRLRTTITPNSITGYEVTCSVIADPHHGNYIQIVRWNGPLGSFTYLDGASGQGHCATGDVLMATISGSKIDVYRNGTWVESATDSTYASGSPGIGFFLQGATGLDANFGFSSVTLSDAPVGSASKH
ncbi:MAG: hypothetical protein ACLQMO_08595 [Acidobacteriaceae bacterium]